MNRYQPNLTLPGTLLITLLIQALSGCEAVPTERTVSAVLRGDIQTATRSVIEDELQRQGIPSNAPGVQPLLIAVSQIVGQLWGEDDPEIATEHRYVKYSGQYQARAIVDFDEGWVRVETVDTAQPTESLRQAIIGTLLTTRDMTVEDIFSGDDPPTGGEPFLYQQVLDVDGKPIRWPWRAGRFADHLLASALRTRREHGRVIHSVQTSLVEDHLRIRGLAYAEEVRRAAKYYGVATSLIYGVIEVESAFNPYAVSPASAYGLMQVVPATAGRDVFQKVKNQSGEPTREQLFRPGFNIDIGSAYLHLLDDLYLKDIHDPSTRRHAIIAAYNGGAGSLLRMFSNDRAEAINKINQLSPQQAYANIVANHPFAETRRYLEKVNRAEARYR